MKKKKRFCFMGILFFVLIAVNPSEIYGVNNEGTETAEAVPPDNIDNGGYDVSLCIDNSKNMWEQQELRDQAIRSICNLAVGADIRVGGVYFGNSVYKSLGLTSMEAKDGSLEVLKNFLNETEKDEGNQNGNIAAGLEGAYQLFEDQDASRNRIIILFTSGISEEENRDDIRKQTELIEKENIPIYCVYLQSHGDDEEYLRDMVNYFRTENSFDEDRFKKITEDQIDELSRQFSEIFYAMQNDMRYRTVSVDSIGKMSFYVPALGVEKLQVFLDGNVEYEAVLDSPTDNPEDALLWTDGKSAYITVNNPTVGDWALDITGEKREEVRGSIAYYAYLSASAAIEEKEGEQILKVKFYDREGNPVTINTGSQVTGDILFEEEGLEETGIRLSPEAEEWCSGSLDLKKTGECKIKLKVQYEDFINLDYTIQGNIPKAREGAAETPKNMKDQLVYGILGAAALAAIAGFLFLLQKRKGRRELLYKEVQEQRERLERKYYSVLQNYKSFNKLAGKLDGTARMFLERWQSFQEDYLEKIPREVLAAYGLLFPFDKEEKERIRAEVSQVKNAAYEKRTKIDKKRQELRIPQSDDREPVLKDIEREIKECFELLGFQEDFLREQMEQMSKPYKNLEKEFKDFYWSLEALDKMLDTPITCSLSLTCKGYTGLCLGSTRTRSVTGYFMLDETAFNTEEGRVTLEELLEGRKTGILVFAFKKEEKEGLEIRSPEKFFLKEDTQEEKPGEYKRAVLLKGKRYEIYMADIEPITLEVR